MKKLLIIAAGLLITIVSSCSRLEFGTSVNDIIGTEWILKGTDGMFGLKFYSNNEVTSFLDNKYGVETINGTYEYLESTKTLSFEGLNWYYRETGKLALSFNGAHIIDSQTMEVIARDSSGEVRTVDFYRQ